MHGDFTIWKGTFLIGVTIFLHIIIRLHRLTLQDRIPALDVWCGAAHIGAISSIAFAPQAGSTSHHLSLFLMSASVASDDEATVSKHRPEGKMNCCLRQEKPLSVNLTSGLHDHKTTPRSPAFRPPGYFIGSDPNDPVYEPAREVVEIKIR